MLLQSKENHKKKDTLQNGRKYLLMKQLTRGLFPKYIKIAHSAQYQRNNQIKKWMDDLNRHFPKEDTKKHKKIFNITN